MSKRIFDTRSEPAHVGGLGTVHDALVPEMAAAEEVTGAERQAVSDELNRRHPDYPPVAPLPTLVNENIRAVASELRAEDTADASLAEACRLD